MSDNTSAFTFEQQLAMGREVSELREEVARLRFRLGLTLEPDQRLTWQERAATAEQQVATLRQGRDMLRDWGKEGYRQADEQYQLTQAAEARNAVLEAALRTAEQYIGGHRDSNGEPCIDRECNRHGFRLIPVLETIRRALLAPAAPEEK